MHTFCHVLDDGSLAIISISEGSPEIEFYRLQKTLFELHRSELGNPALNGRALKDWQMNVHYDDAEAVPLREVRDITGEVLPDRARRHAWRQGWRAGRLKIFDDPTIADRS